MNDSFDEAYSCLKKKKKTLFSQLKDKYVELTTQEDITVEKILEADTEFERNVTLLNNRTPKES